MLNPKSVNVETKDCGWPPTQLSSCVRVHPLTYPPAFISTRPSLIHIYIYIYFFYICIYVYKNNTYIYMYTHIYIYVYVCMVISYMNIYMYTSNAYFLTTRLSNDSNGCVAKLAHELHALRAFQHHHPPSIPTLMQNPAQNPPSPSFSLAWLGMAIQKTLALLPSVLSFPMFQFVDRCRRILFLA